MAPAEQDLVNRRPVWAALSQLYLDSEASAADFRALAATLAGSPYTVDELRRILLSEVHPLCVVNLLQVAGVWGGFELEWLEKQILGRRCWPVRLLPLRKSTLARAAPLFARVAELRRARELRQS